LETGLSLLFDVGDNNDTREKGGTESEEACGNIIKGRYLGKKGCLTPRKKGSVSYVLFARRRDFEGKRGRLPVFAFKRKGVQGGKKQQLSMGFLGEGHISFLESPSGGVGPRERPPP